MALLPTIKVIIADDHPIVLLGIERLVDGNPMLEVTARIGRVDELLGELSKTPCDVLICDFSFQGESEADGFRLVRRLIQEFDQVKVIVLTSHNDLLLVQHMLDLGIAGFISKSNMTVSDLPSIIQHVYRGGRYVDPTIARALANPIIYGFNKINGMVKLSARELEVVCQLTEGMSVSEIARSTGRSVKTVSAQKTSAMVKLGARNDVELIDRFRRYGLNEDFK